MSTPTPGESIWFDEWDTDHFVEYPAIGRAFENVEHGEANLSWFDEGGKETQVNNVKNIEDVERTSTESYWRRRYSNSDISGITGLLETIRVEKGDMVLFRKWDAETHWAGGYFGAVVAVLGAPSAPHPKINLKYINESGAVITVPDLECIESFSDEDAAEGNDLWSNIPEIIGFA